MRVKIQALDSWVSAVVSDTLSPEARSKAVAQFARGALETAQAANRKVLGSDAPVEQFVDGRRGGPLESVNPDLGRIVFEFELVNDVLSWIMTTLAERSPRRTGDYIRGHRLFADGREVDASGDVPAASEYSISNVVPYSRKIEIGRTEAGRDFPISVPNRIYERTAKDARARFGNIAKVGFTFRGMVDGGYVAGRQGNKSELRFPTITVRAT
jgi:hypothetical protein